jgi:hypothetical protein
VRVADERKRALLRELERAVTSALSESSAVHRSLATLAREGFALRVSLDCQARADRGSEEGPASAARPEFRIDSRDLDFLRSIGIDPTRRRRGRG